MAQWYPKISEYDYEGWNTAPYTGREFHGVWGDFDVNIKIDKDDNLVKVSDEVVDDGSPVTKNT